MSQSFAPPDTAHFREMWQAQGGNCALCGAPMPANRAAVAHATLWRRTRPTVDHIRARARGGSDARANLQLAHADCNRRKGRG